MLTSDLSFIDSLTPTQEHFLKKFLLEQQLTSELHNLSEPHSLQNLGPPFANDADDNKQNDSDMVLLRYFFSRFVATFPLIANNSPEDQRDFWKETVEPFVDSFNRKNMSEGMERNEKVTKRHQVNHKLLSSLLLFYNSMFVSKRDMEYLEADHLKSSDQGKLQKLAKGPTKSTVGLEDYQKPKTLDDYVEMTFVNDMNLNIVAVDVEPAVEVPKLWSFNPMKLIVPETTGSPNYFFIIQVTKRSGDLQHYTYRSHFISRPYLDFRHLESLLRKKYPGLMTTDVCRIPHKMKHDDGVTVDDVSVFSDVTGSSTESSMLNKKGIKVKFHREKLRLALRGYLNSLLSKPEIAHCDVFDGFLDDKNRNFSKLSLAQELDFIQRMQLEKSRLDTQQEFQERTAKVVYALTHDFDEFKTQLVREPQQLTALFEELGHTKDREKVSPLLRTFVEWCKLEVAATLYQVFLTQDNLSEWLAKCRKFHRLFPYNVCYGILKYTNPVRIMSRMVDLLLVNIPSFSWGKSQNENKAHNLLSMIFVMLLDEDLEDYLKERAKLMELEPLNLPEYQIFIERIQCYVRDKELDISEEVKEEALSNGENLLITILKTDKLEPVLQDKDGPQMNAIEAAYSSYESLDQHKIIDATVNYVNLRQLWQLEVRRRDKQMLKQLWQEEELTLLIKKLLTLFFQPMMTVMKKCDIHLAFRDWQYFMNDLMDELSKLDEGDIFYMSSVEMFDRFKTLLDKHEDAFWSFMHNLYMKDDQRIFLGIVEWIETFLVDLRLKFVAPDHVTIDVARFTPSEPIDEDLFVSQLDSRIELVLEMRRLLKEYLRNAAHQEADILPDDVNETSGNSRQRAITSEWEKINLGIFGSNNSGFGVAAADVEDYNLMAMHSKTANGMDEDAAYREILRKVAALDSQLRQKVTRGELGKLKASTRICLQNLL